MLSSAHKNHLLVNQFVISCWTAAIINARETVTKVLVDLVRKHQTFKKIVTVGDIKSWWFLNFNDRAAKIQFQVAACLARKNFLVGMSVRKFVMMDDAQTVESLFSNHVDVERLKEKFNATKQNKQKMIFIVKISAKRNEAVEYMSATHNVVNSGTTLDLKPINANSHVKDCSTVKSIPVICLAMLVYARNVLWFILSLNLAHAARLHWDLQFCAVLLHQNAIMFVASKCPVIINAQIYAITVLADA